MVTTRNRPDTDALSAERVATATVVCSPALAESATVAEDTGCALSDAFALRLAEAATTATAIAWLTEAAVPAAATA
jgi:hypothetical protein